MRVLYIEDAAIDADLARRALAKSWPELELEVATRLQAGLQLLDQAAPPFDVVLTDLSLPDGHGMEVLSHVLAQQMPTAVVILTGTGDQDAAAAALKAGAHDYLVKRGNYLERLPRALRLARQRLQERADARTRVLHVLQVEHNPFDVDLLRRHLLQHAPHIRLTAVSDGDAALAYARQHLTTPPAPDVWLVDYRLPGMDGLELIKLLREDHGLDAPVVLMTGQGSEEIASKALQLGATDYLAKHPGYLFETTVLIEKLAQQAELARERAQLREANERLSHVLHTSPTVLYQLGFETPSEPHLVWVSPNIERLMGHAPQAALTPSWWTQHLHPDDATQAMALQALLHRQSESSQEYRFFRADGSTLWLRDVVKVTHDPDGHPIEGVGAWVDVSDHRRAEAIRLARHTVLDQMVSNAPMCDILNDIAHRLEQLEPAIKVAISLVEPRTKTLQCVAGPGLPVDELNRLAREGHVAMPCAAVVASGQELLIPDLDAHGEWQAALSPLRSLGLRAGWYTPFQNDAGEVLGTFSVFLRQVGAPQTAERELVEEFSRITALAVEKLRATEALKQAAAVFQSTRDGVLITDLTPRILAINRAYSDITGYGESEVLGQNPSVLKSGRHDPAFYQSLWTQVIQHGSWQGEIWNRRKNGETYPQWLSISAVYDEQGKPFQFVGVFTDITQLRLSEARLEHLAHHDPLTDLPNRLLLQSRLTHAIERAKRQRHKIAVLYLDLDRFKNVNDSLGHPSGDELLTLLARRLSRRVRESDTLGRLGGDEFLFLLEPVEHPETAATMAQALIDELEEPFLLEGGQQVFVGMSVGISLFPDDASSVTELIQHADMAMFLAKQQGRNTYRFHTEALSMAASRRLTLETRLRNALLAREFVLHYQPFMDARTGQPIGVEALVRWQPPGEDLVSPGTFIPIAEDTGLIVPLGEWVLRTACAQAKLWLDRGLPPLVVAVNLSTRQFLAGNVVELVRRVLSDTELPPHLLELELTESMFLGYAEQSVTTLQALKALGVSLSIDDFGTGYSSLAYLKRFPIDKLKIDQSFVHGLADDPSDREITTTIIAMARNLQLKVLAEGVETEAQEAFLRAHHCDCYQGYRYLRPQPAAGFEDWLRQQAPDRT